MSLESQNESATDIKKGIDHLAGIANTAKKTTEGIVTKTGQEIAHTAIDAPKDLWGAIQKSDPDNPMAIFTGAIMYSFELAGKAVKRGADAVVDVVKAVPEVASDAGGALVSFGKAALNLGKEAETVAKVEPPVKANQKATSNSTPFDPLRADLGGLIPDTPQVATERSNERIIG